MHLDHVALLVPKIESALERVRALDLTPGPIEEFPGEGTRECYLELAPRPARLLLMEALGSEGPYARALAKRGPGLHHVAYTVGDLGAFLDGLTGWVRHRITAQTIESGTAWLAKRGVPTLLEVHQRTPTYGGEPVVSRVELPAAPELHELLAYEGLVPSPDEHAWLTVAGQRVMVEELVR
jgi:hypothetical protein